MQIPAAGQPRAELRSATGQEAAWSRSVRRRRGTAPRQAQPEPARSAPPAKRQQREQPRPVSKKCPARPGAA
eukprot:4500868-Alexandrium_andersonii.AAC.1